MNMILKKIIASLVSLVIVWALLGSCDLNVTNPTNVSSSTFWKNETDVWSAMNTIYGDVIPSVGIYSDTFTDDVRCPYPWESAGSTFQVNGLSTGNDMGYSFSAIRRINTLLTNIVDVPMDEALKKRVIAEARVLRAYEYARLTLAFGKVPLITEVLEYTERDIQRNDVSEVRSFVLSELKEAAKILPASYSGGFFQETNRLTRYGAEALRARVALNFNEFSIAEEAAREVMKGGFALHTLNSLPDGVEREVEQLEQLIDFNALGIDKDAFIQGIYNYRTIWDDENVHVGAPECIIVKEYKAGNSDYADLTRYTSMRPAQMIDGWSSVVPQQPLIDAYLMADGQKARKIDHSERAEKYKELNDDYTQKLTADNSLTFVKLANSWIDSGKYLQYDYFNEFKNRDARLYASILFPFKRVSNYDAGPDFVYEWKKAINNESTTGYNFLKMVAKSTNTLLWGAYPASESDFPVFRYAEILLIFAEAHIHNVGYDAEVEAALNQIRNRVGMPNVPSGLSKDEALKLVRNERRIELAGEGYRLNDIRRYGNDYAKEHMDGVTIHQPDGTAVLTMKWNERMMLFPIPQSAIDVNPLLANDQNPGY